MTRKEAVALLERYSNYDGMGIPNLAGCKEAMKVAVDALNEAYPELAESEDERIRKFLIEILSHGSWRKEWPFSPNEVVAWLEKQKEQKFTHHETNESLEDAVTHQMEDDGDVDDFVRRGIDDIALKYAELGVRWQKEQKPVEWEDYKDKVNVPYCSSEPEWSEEDEKMLAKIIERGQSQIQMFETGLLPEHITWLKSFRHSWKPSAQELGALKTAVSVLTEERTFPKAAEQIQKIIDVFDGKELRKDWKPSEVCYGPKGDPDPAGVWKHSEDEEEEPEYYQHFDPDC